MFKRRAYYRIEAVEDRRKKSIRIRDGLTDLSFTGQLHFHKGQTEIISEFISYPDVEHDDLLDALTIALMCRNPGDIIEGEYEDKTDADEEYLDNWRGCPSLRG
jgi:hypothetical protein